MLEYDDYYEEYMNGNKCIYDNEGNLIAIEHEDGVTEYPVCE